MFLPVSYDKIVAKVKGLMDEAGAEVVAGGDDALFTQDTVKLDTVIQTVMEDALRDVILAAPMHKISASSIKGDKLVFQSFNGFDFVIQDGYGVITLPFDFLRFSSMKLTSWKRSVSEVQEMGTVLWKQQYIPELEAGFFKPVCNWIELKEYGRCIEVHPIKQYELQQILVEFGKSEDEGKAFLASKVSHFTYIPMPTVNHSTKRITPNMDRSLESAVAYMCASLCCLVYEMADASERFKKKAIEIAES